MLVSEKTSIHFSVELSLREISYRYIMYVHMLNQGSKKPLSGRLGQVDFPPQASNCLSFLA